MLECACVFGRKTVLGLEYVLGREYVLDRVCVLSGSESFSAVCLGAGVRVGAGNSLRT